MKKSYLLLILPVLFGGTLSAQNPSSDTVGVTVYFRQGLSTLEPSFRDNGRRLDTFFQQVAELRRDTTRRVHSVRIMAFSSPEGSSDCNSRLSERRAFRLADLLHRSTDLPDSLFEIVAHGVNWEGLTDLVDTSDMPYRDEVLNILRNTPEWVVRNGVVVDGRKRRLGMLHGGRAWQYMYEHFFPKLRGSDVRVVYRITPLPEPVEQQTPAPDSSIVATGPDEATPTEDGTDTVGDAVRDTVILDSAYPVGSGVAGSTSRAPFYMALKTNLLYDAALVPNIGAEFYAGRGWSVGINWMYAWWNSNRQHNYWRIYGGDLSVRKYFGRRAAEKPLTGHHLGLCGQLFTYDFETGGRGYMGGKPGGTLWDKMNYAASLEYGYSLPVGRRLNLDFSIGVGYWGGEYQKYLPKENHYVWTETRQRHWFGPTKAEISLVWLLGRGNYNAKKGGKR